ncbi:type II toxin-antitoxin system PemK/MazF family toxin [Arthrobacter sp. B10-11]|uniref:type II toxin-antitoxin system PemK/MazF family toxin n=1 Tax=Arthrobacter sp. B10-11 TaxID=3081160 RepID=UPI002952A257|nr:type II toxin-antitoxin system PemK/MazF family toxin [Arthrobacter sp. B10-11]MDV8148328.1 type II toxin-antitoxin system PemK/MazF family toxin [Arthrobacter sp. B10-11]
MAFNLRSLGRAVRTALRLLEGRPAVPAPRAGTRPAPARTTPTRSTQPRDAVAGIRGNYPGDFKGTATIKYAPSPNGKPEPGEVVWTWVPYEEDHSQGKDRPVLLIGSRGRFLLGLMLTSKDHDRDRRDDANYVDIGTGSWDRQRRPSEAKLDRVIQISPDDIRREGAVLDRKRFDSVSTVLRELHGWR